jgi:hypothetical protein
LKRANANSFALLAEEDEDDAGEGTQPDTTGSNASDSDASGAGASGAAAAPKRVALTDADRMDHDADGGSFEQPLRRAAPAEPRRGTPGFGRRAAATHAQEDRIDPAGAFCRRLVRGFAREKAEQAARVEREAAAARRAAQLAAELAAERAAGGWTAAEGEDLPGSDSEAHVPQEPAEPPDRGPAPASAQSLPNLQGTISNKGRAFLTAELPDSEAAGTSLEPWGLSPVSPSTSGQLF